MLNYFQFKTSTEILKYHVQNNESVRGYKAEIAVVARCQRSYISQILSGSQQLKVEHAVGLAEFWKMSALERDYFFDVIHCEQAGNSALKVYYTKRVNDARQRAANLSDRFGVDELGSNQEILSDYYSNWIIGAVHVGLTIKELQTPSALAHRLGLPLSVIDSTLKSLLKMGLAKQEQNKFIAIRPVLHLPATSPFNFINHNNWRIKSLQQAATESENATRYTAIYSLSRQDSETLRQMVLQFIDQTRKLVAPSQEEELVGLLIDYFVV
ncbi:MAG: DUF4423 domain-containing protein [Proteobacteria bacterium]|nr:DUF4423 domain-containing protein [Pseudomonadota bacterium]